MNISYDDDALLELECAIVKQCVDDLKPPHRVEKIKSRNRKEIVVNNINTALYYLKNHIGLDNITLDSILKNRGWTTAEILVIKNNNYIL